MKFKPEQILEQFEAALTDYFTNKAHLDYDGSEPDMVRLNTSLGDLVARFAPPNSEYKRNYDALAEFTIAHPFRLDALVGIVTALKNAYEKGFISDFRELVHGEVFSDFIEMSSHLLEEGYKDAAAVIAGGTLEQHLRQLCTKNGIPTVGKNATPLKADFLNSELAKAGVYQKGDQKSVTAWLDLRNKAAHGKYKEYEKEQVALMVQGIRDFITRHPA